MLSRSYCVSDIITVIMFKEMAMWHTKRTLKMICLRFLLLFIIGVLIWFLTEPTKVVLSFKYHLKDEIFPTLSQRMVDELKAASGNNISVCNAIIPENPFFGNLR